VNDMWSLHDIGFIGKIKFYPLEPTTPLTPNQLGPEFAGTSDNLKIGRAKCLTRMRVSRGRGFVCLHLQIDGSIAAGRLTNFRS